jgi:hypothetical protein
LKLTTLLCVPLVAALLAAETVSAQERPIQKANQRQMEGNEAAELDRRAKKREDAADVGLDEGAEDSAGAPLPLDDSAAEPLAEPLAAPAPPPFSGTPRQGLAEIRRLASEGDPSGAALLASSLTERVDRLDEHLLAELRYAGGVAHTIAREHEGAAGAFRSASALSGPEGLRLDAVYNEAVARIVEGEEQRERIIEIAVQDEAVRAGISGPEDLGLGPDALPRAKASYLESRRRLLDRIRMDWRASDARANLEFVQMRLDELAEIEANRDPTSSQQSESEGMETDQTEDGDGSTHGEEESEEQQEEEGSQGSDPESQEESVDEADPTPGEGADEGDDMPNPEAEEREGEEQQKQEQAEQGDENEELESEEGGAQADQEMSPQEKRMILDRLNELDERAKRLRAALQKSRMIEVARDW